MSCWVVPSIAAEYWRIPLDQVLDRINRHAVPIRRENGFTFVDVLPDPVSDNPLPIHARPSTYTAAFPIESTDSPSEIHPVSHHPARLQTSTQRRRPIAA